MTSTPARADTSAMPAPICPAPITPTRSIESLTENSLTQHQAPPNMAGGACAVNPCDLVASAPTHRHRGLRPLIVIVGCAHSWSVELAFLGRTGQRGRRGGRVHRGGDPVEVAG